MPDDTQEYMPEKNKQLYMVWYIQFIFFKQAREIR